eukprot:UN31223
MLAVNDKSIEDLPFSEITEFLQQIQMPVEIQFQVPTMPIEVLDLFNAINLDGSGEITFEQFSIVLQQAHDNDPYSDEHVVCFDEGDYGLAITSAGSSKGCFITGCRNSFAQKHIMVGSKLLKVDNINVEDMKHDEIKDVLQAVKNNPRNLKFRRSERAAKLVEIFNLSDGNNNGKIDFMEFVNACSNPEINMAAVSELANFGKLGDEISHQIQNSNKALTNLRQEMANVNDVGDILKDIQKEP